MSNAQQSSQTFSEFLVEQGLVSADELVGLLIEHARQMPTPAELAREHKLLNSKQLLSVFSYQMKVSVDFNKACFELGLWTPAFEKALGAENDLLRMPVVQLLQKAGKVKTEALVTALDSYLSQNAKPSAVAATAPLNIVTNLIPLEPVEASQVEAEPTKHNEQDNEQEHESDHFKEFYTEALQGQMISLAKEWDQSDSTGTDALVDRVHGLVGAARFAKLGEIEELFKNAESNIRALADCATPLPQAAVDAFRQELVTSFEKGWSLRETAQVESLGRETAV